MYCGHNRMAILSQQQIAEAMMRLLEHELYEDISISDLCREAQVSRQTFYSLFESKDNVMLYKLSRECCYEPGDAVPPAASRSTLQAMCEDYSAYIVSHRALLTLLARNHIMHCLYDCQYQTFLHCTDLLAALPEDERMYAADYFASTLTSIARTYVGRGAVDSAEHLTQILLRLMQGQFFPD